MSSKFINEYWLEFLLTFKVLGENLMFTQTGLAMAVIQIRRQTNVWAFFFLRERQREMAGRPYELKNRQSVSLMTIILSDCLSCYGYSV